MKTKNVLTVAAAAAFALLAQTSFAQPASAPTRAEVKADAKAGGTKAGEGPGTATSSQAGTKTLY